MEKQRKIRLGATYFKVPLTNQNYYGRANVLQYVCTYLRPKEYNPRTRRYEFTFRLYDHHGKYVLLPRMVYGHFISFCSQCSQPVKTKFTKRHEVYHVNIPIDKKFAPFPHQLEPIKFITSHNGEPMRCLDLQTGKGKTFCSIYAASKWSCRSLFIVPGRLMEQWIDEVKKYTGFTDDDIAVWRGATGLKRAFKHDFKPFTFTTPQTLRNFIKKGKRYSGVMSFPQFVKRAGIGLKVVDEAHENFANVVFNDLHCNIPINLYLSATFCRSSSSDNMCFKRIFPFRIRSKYEYDKYVDARVIPYTTNMIDDKDLFVPKGYSQFKYEKMMLRVVRRFNEWIKKVVSVLVQTYFLDIRREDERMLILCSTVEMCEHVAAALRKEHPDVTFITYTQEDKRAKLDDPQNTVVISTIKSCSTGVDIKYLRTVMMTVSTSSLGLILQVFGRLRELKKTKSTPIFLDVYNASVYPHVNHFSKRRLVLNETMNSVKIMNTIKVF